jgi:hypothetical protein
LHSCQNRPSGRESRNCALLLYSKEFSPSFHFGRRSPVSPVRVSPVPRLPVPLSFFHCFLGRAPSGRVPLSMHARPSDCALGLRFRSLPVSALTQSPLHSRSHSPIPVHSVSTLGFRLSTPSFRCVSVTRVRPTSPRCLALRAVALARCPATTPHLSRFYCSFRWATGITGNAVSGYHEGRGAGQGRRGGLFLFIVRWYVLRSAVVSFPTPSMPYHASFRYHSCPFCVRPLRISFAVNVFACVCDRHHLRPSIIIRPASQQPIVPTVAESA